ncbi:MAG: ATP-dependent helicase HrpB [Nocardioides sp.]|nr:ATP-dependent helicase HrpB [Nocardioides sp.]
MLAVPPDLPVVTGLEAVATAVTDRGVAVVQAPPGSGKTTLVPPAVAHVLAAAGRGGRVVVTQPRRIAARAAARRLAGLLEEPVGETVGYAVRGDRRSGPRTRVEMVTPGVLLRRVQRDPELPGTDAVVLDEVHERALDADLLLALLLDVRALRDDLVLVAMSATVEAGRFADLLGDGSDEPAPVVDVPGALHPVATRWAPPPSGTAPLDDRGVTPRFLDHVAAVARRALDADEGDVLVFVPGVREVDTVVRALAGAGADADVVPLHGRLPAAEQDRALRPATGGGRRLRRVVVSTAVAESSLTVPGVRVVVDAGLSREPRTDHRRGLGGLVTVRASRAAADQRAGRAGREAPGSVHRCWTESEHAHLPAHPQPEVAVADLAGLALELAAWGTPDPADLALPDQPPTAALDAARRTLRSLGAVDADGAITARGRLMARVPADPRLARALLDGAEVVGARRAAEVVALLSEDVRAPGGDLVAALRVGRRGDVPGWRAAVDRLRDTLPTDLRDARGEHQLPDDLAVGAVVALAHPDRVARRRDGAADAFVMVGGTGAELRGGAGGGGAGFAGVDWLAVADVDRTPGRRDAVVRSAAPLTEDLALAAAAADRVVGEEVTWTDGRVRARRVDRLGAVVLTETPIGDPSPAAVATAVRDGLRRDGLDALPWTEGARALRRRLAFCHAALDHPWPDVSDDALLAGLDDWLGHALGRVRTARDLARVDVGSALRGLVPWQEAGRLDELAPERVAVPSGSHHRVDYTDPARPVLAVKLQECFGWDAAPALAGGRVPLVLHLLSPAGRPLAVTGDLASFWADAYAGVRAEMRGRYPKHPWPEDPTTAEATARTKRRG